MIFLDNASTTKVKAKVKVEINKYLNNNYANPMAVYGFADEPKEAIDKSRSVIANLIHCDPNNIIFTSGGSEANSLAIKGTAFKYFADTKTPGHIITTEIEHHSILNACKELEEMGIATTTYIKPSEDGRIYDSMLFEAIKNNTILISIGWANNEIGTIQKINRLAKIAEKYSIPFHTDAVQAYGKLPINIKYINLMSVSGHKWGAPKGIGFLYAKNPEYLIPLISGGNQEGGIRGGTHNVPYIAGMGVASRIVYINRDNNFKHETTYKMELWNKLHSLFPDIKINGNLAHSMPNILNLNLFSYGIRGEEMMAFLSEHDIYVSTGSACMTGEPSHVLKAIGLSEDEIDCSLRLSFNENNSLSEIDTVIKVISDGIQYLKR